MHILRPVSRRSLTLCVLLLVATTATAARSGVEAGVAAYKRGDYETALSVFRPLARQGVPRAQSILGLMYSYGEGVPVDHSAAAGWYRKAAEQDYAVAQYNLGMLYVEGKGVAPDLGEGVKWLERAAAGGHFRARTALRELDRTAPDRLPRESGDTLAAPPTALPEETRAGATDATSADGSIASPNADKELPRSVVMTAVPGTEPPPRAAAAAAAIRNNSATHNDSATRNKAATGNKSATSNNAAIRNNANNGAAPRPRPVDGTYRVQLAASRSQELIERDWLAVREAYPDLLGELEGSIERAEIGEEKTVWYRLRVGPFATKSQAEGLCERLDERGVNVGCLPLRIK